MSSQVPSSFGRLMRNLTMIQKAIKNLESLKKSTKNYFSSREIRELYREFKSSKYHNTATNLSNSNESVLHILDNLEKTLKDAQLVLFNEAKTAEQEWLKDKHQKKRSTRSN